MPINSFIKNLFTKRLTPLFYNLRTKILVSFSLIIIVLVVVIDLVGFYGIPFTEFKGDRKNEINERLMNLNLIADIKKNYLKSWINERLDDISFMANNNFTQNTLLKLYAKLPTNILKEMKPGEFRKLIKNEDELIALTSYINRMMSYFSVYHKIEIIDKSSNRIIISSDLKSIGETYKAIRHIEFNNVSEDTHILFEKNIHSAKDMSYFHISQAFDLRDNEERKIKAVIVAKVLTSNFIEPLLHTGLGLGKTGEALLVNQDREILLGLKHTLSDGTIPKHLEYRITADPATFAARGEEGIIESVDYRGESVIASYRHIVIMSNLRWGLVVKIDTDEIFSSIFKRRRQTYLVATTGIIITLILVGFLSSGLTKSVKQMTVMANNINHGNFNQVIKIRSSGEIGFLANTFNDMSKSIFDWKKSLETKINYRTKELQASNQKLRASEQELMASNHQLLANEQELIIASRQFKKSESKYRVLFESSRDAFLTLEPPDWKFTSGNPSTIKMFGLSNEKEFLNLNSWELSPKYQPDGEKSNEKAMKMISKAMKNGDNFFEWTHKRFKGKEFPATVLLTKFKLENRDFLQATVRDITKAKEDEKEKENLQLQLFYSEKMKSIGIMANGIAHNFNNILATIKGYAEMAIEDVSKKSRTSSDLKFIIEGIDTAHLLVNKMLMFSRTDKPNVSKIDISQTVENAIKMFIISLKGTVELNKQIEAGCGYVMADTNEIQQAIFNVCNNSAHAIEKNGGIIELKLSKVTIAMDFAEKYENLKEGKYIKLTIKDTGYGIDKEILSHIFEPFYTTKEVGEGTGLGLSMVHGVVKSYNGEIIIESEQGIGTTVAIYLPSVT